MGCRGQLLSGGDCQPTSRPMFRFSFCEWKHREDENWPRNGVTCLPLNPPIQTTVEVPMVSFVKQCQSGGDTGRDVISPMIDSNQSNAVPHSD